MNIFICSWLCYLFCKLWIIHPEVAGDYCERIEEMEDSKDTIIVTGIPEKTEKVDFVNYFSSVGEISVSDLRAEKREGIITYTDVTNVPKAVLQFNEKDFKGSYITVLKPEEFFKQCSTKPEDLPKDVKNMAWHLWFLPNVGGIGGKGGKGGSGGWFGSSGQDWEDGVGEMGGKGGKGGGLFGWFRSKKQEEPAQHSSEGGGQGGDGGGNGGGQGGKGGSGFFGFFKGQDGQPGEAGPGGKGGKGGKGGSLL